MILASLPGRISEKVMKGKKGIDGGKGKDKGSLGSPSMHGLARDDSKTQD